jgi:hypothetical protein
MRNIHEQRPHSANLPLPFASVQSRAKEGKRELKRERERSRVGDVIAFPVTSRTCQLNSASFPHLICQRTYTPFALSLSSTQTLMDAFLTFVSLVVRVSFRFISSSANFNGSLRLKAIPCPFHRCIKVTTVSRRRCVIASTS